MEGRTGSTDGLPQAFIQRRSSGPWLASAEVTAADVREAGQEAERATTGRVTAYYRAAVPAPTP